MTPTDFRIIHGPINLCGIGRYLADWQRNHCADSDFIVYQDDRWTPNAHFNLRVHELRIRYQIPLKVLFFLYCLIRYNLFHFYFGITLLPYNLDLPILRLFGKKIVMNYCGSDIRLMSVEAKRNPYWKLFNRGVDSLEADASKRRRMYWQRLWVHRVIAVRNLFAHAIEVFPKSKIISDIWTNNSFAMEEYSPISWTTKTIPTLIHAPTAKGVKGTSYVIAAIDELRRDGYQFEFRILDDVPNDEAQRIYRQEADIIIDQLLMGGIGNLAFEGMYAGKPVVAYVLEDVKREFLPDCPVVNTTIEDLKDKLVWLIGDAEERVRLGRAGREFVEKHCDRETINRQLWEVYRSL